MSRMKRTSVGAGLAAVALLLGTVSAGAGLPPVVLDPTSGPPGTEITASSTGCTSQTEVPHRVSVQLLDTSDQVQDSDDVAVTDGQTGDWEATLTVPSGTTDYGEWTVIAECYQDYSQVVLNSARAGRSAVLLAGGTEPLFEYQSAPFQVTEPVQEETTTTEATTTTTEAPATSPIVAQPTYTG